MKNVPAALIALSALALSSNTAHAACEKQVQATEKATGAALVDAYSKVVTCDKKVAEQVFFNVMQLGNDLETLTALSLVAIRADIWTPVWQMPSKIKDYAIRDEVANSIGEACSTEPKVVAFLEGAYFGLRDIEFQQWDDALVVCNSTDFDDWLLKQIENPPAKQYDEKWMALTNIYVKRKGSDSLGALSTAAVKAAQNGGPFEAILSRMDEAVAPGLGDEFDPEKQKALENALVTMAKQLPPDRARPIADRLSNSGSDAAAASLLPIIYPDRLKGGGFEYGAVSVEAGECKGTKTALLHVATVSEPGKHYVMAGVADGPMRSFKPGLKKCTMEGEWTVVVSAEPIKGKEDIEALVSATTKQWADKGYTTKRKDEKPIAVK